MDKEDITAKEQKQIGEIMDRMERQEKFLKAHKEQIYSSDRYFLYRLPLTDSQRRDIVESFKPVPMD